MIKELQLDLRGMLCPRPLIEFKKFLRTQTQKESFLLNLILDNETACENLIQYLKEKKYKVQQRENSFNLLVEIKSSQLEHQEKPTKNLLFIISSSQMGEGEKDLGELLMSAFLNTLKELDELKDIEQNIKVKIIFYHSGVKMLLADEHPDVVDSLRELKNVAILACGTCLDYYGVKSKIPQDFVSITNMMSIMEAMLSADKVVKP